MLVDAVVHALVVDLARGREFQEHVLAQERRCSGRPGSSSHASQGDLDGKEDEHRVRLQSERVDEGQVTADGLDATPW